MNRRFRRWKLQRLAALFLISLAVEGTAQSQTSLPRISTYWLTDTVPKTAQRYGPLLLFTNVSLEQLSELAVLQEEVAGLSGGLSRHRYVLDLPAFYLETHQKDSIWNGDGQPIKQFLGKRDPEVEDIIKAYGRSYRISPATYEEVARLLREPRGTQPLHRRFAPVGGAERTIQALRLLLENQQVEQGRSDASLPATSLPSK